MINCFCLYLLLCKTNNNSSHPNNRNHQYLQAIPRCFLSQHNHLHRIACKSTIQLQQQQLEASPLERTSNIKCPPLLICNHTLLILTMQVSNRINSIQLTTRTQQKWESHQILTQTLLLLLQLQVVVVVMLSFSLFLLLPTESTKASSLAGYQRRAYNSMESIKDNLKRVAIILIPKLILIWRRNSSNSNTTTADEYSHNSSKVKAVMPYLVALRMEEYPRVCSNYQVMRNLGSRRTFQSNSSSNNI